MAGVPPESVRERSVDCAEVPVNFRVPATLIAEVPAPVPRAEATPIAATLPTERVPALIVTAPVYVLFTAGSENSPSPFFVMPNVPPVIALLLLSANEAPLLTSTGMVELSVTAPHVNELVPDVDLRAVDPATLTSVNPSVPLLSAVPFVTSIVPPV